MNECVWLDIFCKFPYFELLKLSFGSENFILFSWFRTVNSVKPSCFGKLSAFELFMKALKYKWSLNDFVANCAFFALPIGTHLIVLNDNFLFPYVIFCVCIVIIIVLLPHATLHSQLCELYCLFINFLIISNHLNLAIRKP